MTPGAAESATSPDDAPAVDERIMGAGTTWRLVLLIVLVVAAGYSMVDNLFETFSSAARHAADARVRCFLASGLDPSAGTHQTLLHIKSTIAMESMQRCLAASKPNPWVAPALTVFLITTAAGLYFGLPAWKGRTSKVVTLDEVDHDGSIRARLDVLLRQAGLTTRPPRFVVDPMAVASTGAHVFGTGKSATVCLHSGLVAVAAADPRRFRAVLLHELAHIRNRDVPVIFATSAVWRTFVVAILLPEAASDIYRIATIDVPWGDQALLRQVLIQEILIALLVYLVQRSVLRSREVYADLAAARWGADRAAWLASEDGPQAPPGWMARARTAFGELWSTHPTWTVRTLSLKDPSVLFQLDPLSMFTASAAGAVIAVAFSTGTFRLPHSVAKVVDVLLPLTAAGFITAICGLAVWRAVVYALVKGHDVPSGWKAGLSCGAGLAVAELTDYQVTGNRWIPTRPEIFLVLVLVPLFLMVWIAQFARLRITTFHGRRPLTPVVLGGLIAPWLTLAYVFSWWYSGGGFLANGLPFSIADSVAALNIPGLATHPGVLVKFFVVEMQLFSNMAFTGFWWAPSLLWLVPLLAWAARPTQAVDAPDRHEQALPRTAALHQGPGSALPRLRPVLQAALLGGALCLVGLEAVRARRNAAVADGGPPPAHSVLASFSASLLVIAGTTVLVALGVALTRRDGYSLIRALIAAGATSVFGLSAAIVVISPSAAILLMAGLALGPLVVVAGVTALLTLGVRSLFGRRADEAQHALADRGEPTKPRPVRRLAVQTIAGSAVCLMVAATVMAGTTPNSASTSVTKPAGDAKSPPGSEPESARIRLNQILAWVNSGGQARFTALIEAQQDYHNAIVAYSADETQAVFAAKVAPACLKIISASHDADAFFPVPLDVGQAYWSKALAGYGEAATACRTAVQQPTEDNVNAVTKGIEHATGPMTSFLQWIAPAKQLKAPSTTG
ncbi:M48 family metalloprotease [Streptomyces sp. NPDC059456]|uniref:M48 family metalloprotease n=1 Tax=Streptomyces sp. NPDC059456 TaxID=3346838 RepID=UPI0036BDEA85